MEKNIEHFERCAVKLVGDNKVDRAMVSSKSSPNHAIKFGKVIPCE